jgi:hypothetical protein
MRKQHLAKTHLHNTFDTYYLLIDTHKMDEWEVLIESDIKEMEWIDPDSDTGSDSGSDSEENESSEEEMDMA